MPLSRSPPARDSLRARLGRSRRPPDVKLRRYALTSNPTTKSPLRPALRRRAGQVDPAAVAARDDHRVAGASLAVDVHQLRVPAEHHRVGRVRGHRSPASATEKTSAITLVGSSWTPPVSPAPPASRTRRHLFRRLRRNGRGHHRLAFGGYAPNVLADRRCSLLRVSHARRSCAALVGRDLSDAPSLDFKEPFTEWLGASPSSRSR